MSNNLEPHCKTPCIECPFRKDALRGFLGGFSVQETIECAKSESEFHCHLTREDGLQPKTCAGRMLFVSNLGKSFRNQELEKIRKFLKESTPEEIKNTILSYREFIQHHTV